MKTTILLCLFLVTNCLISFAQEKGKLGLRLAAGISTLHDQQYKFTPISAYSLGLIFLEKDKPFSIRYELFFENKGACSVELADKFMLGSMSLNILPQIKFKSAFNHALLSGIYLSYLIGPNISLPATNDIAFSHFDTGLILAYKYTFLRTKIGALQIDPRFSYSFFNINNHTFGDSKWTRNAVAQVGLNFIIGK